MLNTLVLYLLNNPAYLNTPQYFQIGYIGTDASLSDVTSSCTIEILQPTGAIIVDTNYLLYNSELQYATIELAVTYSTLPIFYFQLCLVRPFYSVTQKNLYNTYRKYLPQNVYTSSQSSTSPVFLDDTSLTTVLEQIYDNSATADPAFVDLNTIVSRFFPDSGYPAWEQYLVGTNSLYLQENAGSNYPLLLQEFYQTNINNNTNPYFLALSISQYIYYRLGDLYYVYIGEDVFNITDAFILNENSLGHCILSGSANGSTPTLVIIYIMNGSGLSSQFQTELYNFVRRIMRAGALVQLDYTHTFTDFGLATIGNTYWHDPRQNNTYCLQWNPGDLAQALGYAGGGSTITVVSFTVVLSGGIGTGTTLAPNTTYTVTITPVFSTPTLLPLPADLYTYFYSENYAVMTTFLSGETMNFQTFSAGTVTMQIYLGTILNTITYTIT
jgi:hypothetical protein